MLLSVKSHLLSHELALMHYTKTCNKQISLCHKHSVRSHYHVTGSSLVTLNYHYFQHNPNAHWFIFSLFVYKFKNFLMTELVPCIHNHSWRAFSSSSYFWNQLTSQLLIQGTKQSSSLFVWAVSCCTCFINCQCLIWVMTEFLNLSKDKTHASFHYAEK